MPANIKTQYMSKMFPFRFFDELSEKMTDFIIQNPVFILGDRIRGTEKQREQYYHQSRKPDVINTMNAQNIIEVEPFGEVLILDVCIKKDDLPILENEPKKAKLLPLSMLVVQYYDSADMPVFSKDVTEDTIKAIPEILWDDPRLMIAVVTIGRTHEQDSNVAVIKIPDTIENKILEPIEEDDIKEQDID